MNRRNFVTALAAAPLAAQSSPAPRIGIIGLGARSRAHFDALKRLPEANIVALSDLDSKRIEAANALAGVKAAGYTDYRELLKDNNVGQVVIVAPNFLHHDMVLAALRAGKDVLVEKPIALSYREAREMDREAKRLGRVLAVGMQRRYSAADVKVRELVESGRVGPVRLISYAEYRGDWNPNSWKFNGVNWRFQKRTAGSSELEFSVHSYGFVFSLVKSPLVRASASGAVVHYAGRETRDVSTVLVEFANGARLQHSFCLFAPGAQRMCTIVGDRGFIEWHGSKLQVRGEQGPPVVEEIPRDAPAEVQLYRDFFRAVRDRSEPATNAGLAIEATKIAWAADLAISQGRVVTAADFAE